MNCDLGTDTHTEQTASVHQTLLTCIIRSSVWFWSNKTRRLCITGCPSISFSLLLLYYDGCLDWSPCLRNVDEFWDDSFECKNVPHVHLGFIWFPSFLPLSKNVWVFMYDVLGWNGVLSVYLCMMCIPASCMLFLQCMLDPLWPWLRLKS